MESLYEYGSRAGFWRLHRLFTERRAPGDRFWGAPGPGVNPAGIVLFVHRHGITAAGVVWGVTIVIAAVLPGWQCRHLGIHTLGHPALIAAVLSTSTFGITAGLSRMTMGDNAKGLVAAGIVGAAGYLVGLRWAGPALSLHSLRPGAHRSGATHLQPDPDEEHQG